jgi:hypothetical protein
MTFLPQFNCPKHKLLALRKTAQGVSREKVGLDCSSLSQ